MTYIKENGPLVAFIIMIASAVLVLSSCFVGSTSTLTRLSYVSNLPRPSTWTSRPVPHGQPCRADEWADVQLYRGNQSWTVIVRAPQTQIRPEDRRISDVCFR